MKVFAYIIWDKYIPYVIYIPIFSLHHQEIKDITNLKLLTKDKFINISQPIPVDTDILSHTLSLSDPNINSSLKEPLGILSRDDIFETSIKYYPNIFEQSCNPDSLIEKFIYVSKVNDEAVEVVDYIIIRP